MNSFIHVLLLANRRTDYTHADDTDPFLPRPPPYESDYGAISQSSPRPWSERGSLQHSARLVFIAFLTSSPFAPLHREVTKVKKKVSLL